jgi:hypothetical protein
MITVTPVLMSGLLRNHCLALAGIEDSFWIPSCIRRRVGVGGGGVAVDDDPTLLPDDAGCRAPTHKHKPYPIQLYYVKIQKKGQ